MESQFIIGKDKQIFFTLISVRIDLNEMIKNARLQIFGFRLMHTDPFDYVAAVVSQSQREFQMK